MNLGLLQEQSVLFTSKPSLRPHPSPLLLLQGLTMQSCLAWSYGFGLVYSTHIRVATLMLERTPFPPLA